MLLPIAIPSYNRALVLLRRTLKFLHKNLYPSHLITIFVADSEQFKIYQDAIPKNLYNEIVVGVKGLCEQRHFISSYYPQDTMIVQMDDDLKGFVGDKSLIEVIEMGHQLMTEQNAGVFSIMPNSDKRRLKDDYTTHLAHCIGSFFIVRNDKRLLPTGTELEDYERSVLSFIHYKSVIRYRGAGVDTDYGKTPGGLQEEGRYERIQAGVKRMIDTYPIYCIAIKKGDRPDVRLNHRCKPMET